MSWISEIELARKNADEYGNMALDCVEELLKVFDNQGHSGHSASITANLFKRLVDNKPLSNLTGEDDEWNYLRYDYSDSEHVYQNKRYSALFKHVHDDGRISYSDVDRFVCHTADKPDVCFGSGLVNKLLGDMFPIQFPYYPERWNVELEEFLVDKKNGDFDTVHIVSAIDNKGHKKYIEKFFTELNGKFEEISKDNFDKLMRNMNDD